MNRFLRLAMILPALALLGCTDGATDTDTDTTDTGDTGDTGTVVDNDNDGYTADEDCNDDDAAINPGADEICDGVDNNCDDAIDEGLRTTYYLDDDRDGEGDPATGEELCEAEDGYVDNNTDCDDTDRTLNTKDVDADGVSSCAGDCDDAVASVLPGAPEVPGNAVDEDCVDGDLALEGVLLLNEIHYDPSNDDLNEDGNEDGDANGDGVRDAAGDEFVELINMAGVAIDISGFLMWDTDNLTDELAEGFGTPNHTVPAGTILQPGKAFVVFGGGTPTGDFGGALVQTSTYGDLNLNNAGDLFTLQDSAGITVLTYDIEPLSNNPNESYTRNPDITGELEQHNDNTPLLFSPGTKIDGTPF